VRKASFFFPYFLVFPSEPSYSIAIKGRKVVRNLFARFLQACLFFLAGFSWRPGLAAEEYVERFSSFETEAEAYGFTYDGGDKGWAKVSGEQACHGKQSLKLRFVVTEAETGGNSPSKFRTSQNL
jgi:hypothetical protein